MPRVTTETRRAQIVDALAQLLEERSYAEASVANIASVAGLTPGLVHYHFATKRQILLALVERVVEGWRARTAQRLVGVDDPAARVRAVVDATLDLGAGARPADARLWGTLGGEAARNEDVAQAVRHALTEAMQQLEHDLGALGVRAPAQTARALVAAMEGVFRLAALGLVPEGEGAALVHRLVDAVVAR